MMHKLKYSTDFIFGMFYANKFINNALGITKLV